MSKSNFSDAELLEIIEGDGSSSADSKTAVIGDALHERLYGQGITIRHKPKTGGKYTVKGNIANDVVTNYVEHAFIAWLLMKFHSISPPQMPEGVNCQSDDVDAEVFFLDDVVIEDFLDGDFEDGAGEGNEARQRYMAALEENDRKRQEAKRICDGCPFSLDCLTNSIINNSEAGVWGGLDESERHLMINRFESMRRSYLNGKLPKALRKDLEERTEQIVNAIRREARAEKMKTASLVEA